MKRSALRLAAALVAGLALAAVFAAYLQPAFLFGITNLLWSCF